MKPFPKDSPGGIPRIIPGRKSMNDELAFYVSNNIVIYDIYIYIYILYTLYTILNSYIVKLEKNKHMRLKPQELCRLGRPMDSCWITSLGNASESPKKWSHGPRHP